MTKPQAKEREQTPDLLKDVSPGAKPIAPKTQPKNAVAKIAPVKPPVSVMSGLAELLKNPDLDPAKARELYELYMLTEAKQQFHDAMVVMDEQLPRINKDGKIDFRDTTKKPILFASFENLNRQIKPIIRGYGFRLNFQPDTAPAGQGLVVHCHLTRYGTIALLNIETEAPQDRDTDAVVEKKNLRPAAGAAAEPKNNAPADPNATITGAQAKELLKAINDSGIEATRFMGKYEINAVHELKADRFQEAMTALKDYGEAAAKAAKVRRG